MDPAGSGGSASAGSAEARPVVGVVSRSSERKRIWFELTNSPHVHLFAHMIRDLARDHEILITARPLANTLDLLRLEELPFRVVGRHYGASLARKIYGYPVRVWQLRRVLADWQPDVAVSQSSFHSPLVAALLGVRSIYLNDNEHALGNVPSFLFATTVMIPEYLDRRKVRLQGARSRKIVQYPGVKEGIYLWTFEADWVAPEQREDRRPSVYLRPEPRTAQYYKGALNFLDDLVLGLKDAARVTILPRDATQAEHYGADSFSGVRVVRGALDLETIVRDCDLFIGAGGTMTREMAVLGVPTISVYQADLLDVDRYLLDQGRLIHRPRLDARFVLDHLEKTPRRPPSQDLLQKGRRAYDLIKATIISASVPARGIDQPSSATVKS